MNSNSDQRIIEVLTKYKPSKYVSFMYRLFNSTQFKTFFPLYLGISFLAGFILIQSGLKSVAVDVILIAFGILGVFAITSFIAVQINNYDIRQIAKELNVSLEEVAILFNLL